MGRIEKSMCDQLGSFKRFGHVEYKILHGAAGLVKSPFHIKETENEISRQLVLSISSRVQGIKKATFLPAEIVYQTGKSLQHQMFKRLEIQTDSYGITDHNSGYPARVKALIKEACYGDLYWPKLFFEERGVSVLINAPFMDFMHGNSVKMNYVALFVGRLIDPNNASRYFPHCAAQLIFSFSRSDEAIARKELFDSLAMISFNQMMNRKSSGRIGSVK